MRARYAATRSFDVASPRVIASCSSGIVFSITSNVGRGGAAPRAGGRCAAAPAAIAPAARIVESHRVIAPAPGDADEDRVRRPLLRIILTRLETPGRRGP